MEKMNLYENTLLPLYEFSLASKIGKSIRFIENRLTKIVHKSLGFFKLLENSINDRIWVDESQLKYSRYFQCILSELCRIICLSIV